MWFHKRCAIYFVWQPGITEWEWKQEGTTAAYSSPKQDFNSEAAFYNFWSQLPFIFLNLLYQHLYILDNQPVSCNSLRFIVHVRFPGNGVWACQFYEHHLKHELGAPL